MKRFPDRHNYLRNPDDYGTAELCTYAREILTRGRDKEAYSPKLTTSWENEDEKVTLHCTDTTKKHPVYQMNVEDKRGLWPLEHIYMIQDDLRQVGLYYVNPTDNSHEEVEQENPMEIIGFVMGYMRRRLESRPGEPLNNTQTEQAFREIMANIAIDSAIAEKLFDFDNFTADYQAGSRGIRQNDINAILAQGITDGDIPFAYTTSDEDIFGQLSNRALHVTQDQANRQIMPRDSTHTTDDHDS